MADAADSLIYHVCSRATAVAARTAGNYRAPSLDCEGFIHFSRAHQVRGVLERFYAGQTDLVLLVVDPRLLSAPLKYETPAPVAGARKAAEASDGLFPHVYGALNGDAIVDVREVRDMDGSSAHSGIR